jgi:hypothetical protein
LLGYAVMAGSRTVGSDNVTSVTSRAIVHGA